MESKNAMGYNSEDGYYDLGDFHWQVSTKNPEAQRWFDRGVIWSYGFNHEASIECFEQAIRHDPDLAMAYWGLALSLGPNYNKPWEFYDEEELRRVAQRAYEAMSKARQLATTATPVERALIEAARSRYPQPSAPEDGSVWNQKYANAMGPVYEAFKEDPNVATLYADAMMNLKPWSLWDIRTGKPTTGAPTLLIKDVLEQGIGRDHGRFHPGLLHLYIHLMEMSPCPEQAMNAADRLRGLVPDAGHLQHMPTHLDVLCGDYRRGVASNSDAIKADNKYLLRAGATNFYTLYRSHDYHFRIYAAMFAGQSRVALDTVAESESSIPEDLLRVKSPPMADWLEGFVSVGVHVLVRFGKWEDILQKSFPPDRKLYCVTTSMLHYARGVAYAAIGETEQAQKERAIFHNSLKQVPKSRTLFNNTCLDILSVARAMLDGEIEYRLGNHGSAFEHLQRAINLDDNLPYDEPWGWMQPTRHAYGALLLEQGHVEKAAAVYSADLGYDDTLPRALQHPNNVWSLHGYHECLVKLGKVAEAAIVKPQLRLALAVADIEISSSCFCRSG